MLSLIKRVLLISRLARRRSHRERPRKNRDVADFAPTANSLLAVRLVARASDAACRRRRGSASIGVRVRARNTGAVATVLPRAASLVGGADARPERAHRRSRWTVLAPGSGLGRPTVVRSRERAVGAGAVVAVSAGATILVGLAAVWALPPLASNRRDRENRKENVHHATTLLAGPPVPSGFAFSHGSHVAPASRARNRSCRPTRASSDSASEW